MYDKETNNIFLFISTKHLFVCKGNSLKITFTQNDIYETHNEYMPDLHVWTIKKQTEQRIEMSDKDNNEVMHKPLSVVM